MTGTDATGVSRLMVRTNGTKFTQYSDPFGVEGLRKLFAFAEDRNGDRSPLRFYPETETRQSIPVVTTMLTTG